MPVIVNGITEPITEDDPCLLDGKHTDMVWKLLAENSTENTDSLVEHSQ